MVVSPYEDEKMKEGGLRANRRVSATSSKAARGGISKRKLEFNGEVEMRSDLKTKPEESLSKRSQIRISEASPSGLKRVVYTSDNKSLMDDDVQITKVVINTPPSVSVSICFKSGIAIHYLQIVRLKIRLIRMRHTFQ